jgi:hypothetical protein
MWVLILEMVYGVFFLFLKNRRGYERLWGARTLTCVFVLVGIEMLLTLKRRQPLQY